MKLIIAEKPLVGNAIAQALGGFSKAESGRFLSNKKDCIITWGSGHLIEMTHPVSNDINKLPILPKSDEWQLNVIESKNGAQEQMNVIQKLVELEAVTEIVNACDAGREGELIGRLIYMKTGTKKPLKRMWINSMTKPMLVAAYKGICDAKKYDGLNLAAMCRSQMDWCIGINGSIAATTVINRKEDMAQNTQIGRVKIPVVMLVIERERAINNFVSKDFWEIKGTFNVNSSSQEYLGKWINYEELLKKRSTGLSESNTSLNEDDEDDEGEENGPKNNKAEDESNSLYRFENEAQAKNILKECKEGRVTQILETKTQRKRNPPNLFDLGAIQYLANKLYKLSAKKTLEIIQELYEKHQAVTYPRTDSTHLPEDYPSECIAILDKLAQSHIKDVSDFAEEAKLGVNTVKKHVFDNSKISDHFAIIPTGVIPKIDDQNTNRIYQLIVRRFKEAFLPPMEYNETERFTFIGKHAFRSVGEEVIDFGWKNVEKANIERIPESQRKKGKAVKDKILPLVSDFKDVSVVDVKAPKSSTKPPKRYNNGTLLNTMKHISKTLEGDEKAVLKDCGIGTPATRAGIIDELFSTTNSKGEPKKAMLEERGNNKEIHPTLYGIKVIEFLEDNKIDFLTEVSLTAQYEIRLNEIVEEPEKSVEFMRDVYSTVTNFIDRMKQANSNIPIRKLKNTKCPKCESDMHIEPRNIICSSASCTYRIPRIISGKLLENESIAALINNGITEVIDGFINKDSVFSAVLRFEKNEEGKQVIKFFFPVEKYKDNCPICNSEMMKTLNSIKCNSSNCGLTIWNTVFGKRLTEKHIDQLIEKGITEQIDGFLSKVKKTNYSGILKINQELKRIEMTFDGVKEVEHITETKFKCLTENCSGVYSLINDYKYQCFTCNKFFHIKNRGQKPYTSAQIKKLLKGEHITHVFKTMDADGKKEVNQTYDVFINKYGTIRKVLIEE
jgi:DNA topoisomerase III